MIPVSNVNRRRGGMPVPFARAPAHPAVLEAGSALAPTTRPNGNDDVLHSSSKASRSPPGAAPRYHPGFDLSTQFVGVF